MSYTYTSKIYHEPTTGSLWTDFKKFAGNSAERLSAAEIEALPDTTPLVPEWSAELKQACIAHATSPVAVDALNAVPGFSIPSTDEEWCDLALIQNLDPRVVAFPVNFMQTWAHYILFKRLMSDLPRLHSVMPEECFLATCSLLLESTRSQRLARLLSGRSSRSRPLAVADREVAQDNILTWLEELYNFLEDKEFEDNGPKKHIRWMIKEVFRDQEN